GIPRTSMRSLTPIGMPCSGPVGEHLSCSRALAIAFALSTWSQALTSGSRASMCSIQERVSASLVSLRPRIRPAAWAALRKQGSIGWLLSGARYLHISSTAAIIRRRIFRSYSIISAYHAVATRSARSPGLDFAPRQLSCCGHALERFATCGLGPHSRSRETGPRRAHRALAIAASDYQARGGDHPLR